MSEHRRPARKIQAAPHRGRSTVQSGPLPLKATLALIAAMILVVSAVGYFTVGRLGNELASARNTGLANSSGLDGAVDILLVGTDSRTDVQGNTLPQEELERLNAGIDDGELNTDTMMIIRVPADGSKATAVSIPRDTYVHDDNYGNMKINAVYANYKMDRAQQLINEGEQDQAKIERESAEAGRSGLTKVLGELTGVEIDHYAEVGLHGFVMLTDAVGGVNVCLNEDVDDEFSGARFSAGEQTLDGAQALSFVRQRHGLPRGDLDRIVRQQAFMASLVSKVLSTGTLTSPNKLSAMADAVEKSVVIDNGWNIMSFATQLANLAGGNVTFTTIPVTSVDGVGDYGESIITIDQQAVHSFFDNMVTEEEAATEAKGAAPPAPEVPKTFDGIGIHVLNAGTTSGLAGGVGAWLQEKGLNVTEVTNAMPGIYSTSQVVAADANNPAARELAEMLGGLEVTENSELDSGTLVVVTADEYSGPLSQAVDDPSTDTQEPPTTQETVGTPGEDFGHAEVGPEIDAGGRGVRCVN